MIVRFPQLTFEIFSKCFFNENKFGGGEFTAILKCVTENNKKGKKKSIKREKWKSIKATMECITVTRVSGRLRMVTNQQ